MSAKGTSDRMKSFWSKMTDEEKKLFIEKRQAKAREGYRKKNHLKANIRKPEK